MKITLENGELMLSDELFDGAGFVDVVVVKDNEYHNLADGVHINELYSAVQAFKIKHDESLKRDKLLRD